MKNSNSLSALKARCLALAAILLAALPADFLLYAQDPVFATKEPLAYELSVRKEPLDYEHSVLVFASEASARGRREYALTARAWGRYAVEVKSAEGVSVEVVDKLRGAIARSGLSGEKDGRLEVFLEAGDYKVFTEGPPDAVGTLSLTVSRFSVVEDGSKGGYGYLRPFEQASSKLGALEARAWWIFVPRDTLVYIEAMGRRLGALAVFRNGDWLAAESGAKAQELADGDGDEEGREHLNDVYDDEYGNRSRRSRRGGYGDEYGGDDEERGIHSGQAAGQPPEPDFVNRSVPEKALNGLRIIRRLERGKHLVVAYGGGADQYTVSDAASPLYVSWMLKPLDPSRQLSAKVNAGGVNRYAVPPKTKYLIESVDKKTLRVDYNIINKDGGMGQAYGDTLRSHPLFRTNPIGAIEFSDRSSGQQVLSVSGAPGAGFKITPIGSLRLDYTPKESGEHRLFTVHTNYAGDNIGASGILVDLKDTSILALRVDTVSSDRPVRRKFNAFGAEQTSYVWVDETGAYTFSPSGGASNFHWRVKRFYVSEPRNYKAPSWMAGRSDVSLSKGLYVIEINTQGNIGAASFALFGKRLGSESLIKPLEPNPSIDIKPLTLEKGRAYRFYLNDQGAEYASIVVERYPAPPSENTAALYLTGEAAEKAELGTSQSAELKIGTPQYVSLGVKGIKAYGFTIGEAGIYKIETLGRMHTKLTARDRFGGLSYSRSGNGVGRNALIAEYFLPGSYMVVAETVGKSAGRMGVVLTKGEMVYGGRLQSGVDSRAAVKENGAVAYDFTADKKGRYLVESFGPSSEERGDSRMGKRLEDSNGWPLFRHGLKSPMTVELEKGAYKLYSLPAAYENYRVTRIEEAAERRTKVSGAGPHKININEPVTAVWVEASGKPQLPARFLFETTASAEMKISLSPDFNGELVSMAGKDTALIKFDGVHSGVLRRGKYEIRVTPKSPRNHQPYELSVAATDLFDGIGYPSNGKEMLRVQVGAPGTYEIFSQGKAEVSARLYAKDKKTEIARSGSDQRDWNFIIAEKLDSGTYYLQPAMGQSWPWMLPIKIFMRRAVDTLAQTVKLSGAEGEKRKVQLSGKQVVIPIEIQSGDVLTLTARSSVNVVCELSAVNSKSPIGRRSGKRVILSAPVEKGARYNLKIWPEDRINDEASIEMKTVTAIPLAYSKARSGVTGTAEKGGNSAVFYRINGVDAGPGHYELITTENEISRASGVNAVNRAFEEEESSIIASAGKSLFIEAAFRSPEKFRFMLSPVLITDVSEILEKNKGKSETADKHRNSKNHIKYTERGELPITIKQNKEKIFAIDAPAQKFGVVTLTAPSGQPMAGLSAPPQAADFVRSGMPVAGGQYVDKNVCKAAVLPGDTGRIISWNAQTSGASEMNGALMMRNYTVEKADTLKIGRVAWNAKASMAKEYRIAPNSNRAVTVKLSPRTGAAYVSASGKRSMYYGGEDGAEYTVEPDGGRLFLFGDAEGDDEEGGGIELEMYALSPQANDKRKRQTDELTAGAETVKQFLIDTREAVRIKNDAQSSMRLFLSGAAESADWINKSGQITANIKNGHKLTKEGGMLFVNYAAGIGKLKLCKDDGNQAALNDCRWGEPVKKDNAPVIKELSKLTMADGVNWYSVELTEPAHLSLHAPAPAAAVTVSGGKIRDYEEFWEDLTWNLPLPEGKFTIGIKPLTGRSLAGVPLAVGFYPIRTLTEEKPIEMHLMASQKRLIKFDIKKKGNIGLGMSTQGQSAEATLLDAKGKSITKGSQIFTKLDKGTYHILLSAPPSSTQSASSVKLYLFGQSAPPASPPNEVIQWIIKDGTGERPLSSSAGRQPANSSLLGGLMGE
ncbi:MAG: hypothetical protein LBH93_00365 [Chitinispirillales bacterium]|jgi:hypothetical protein|nr:hypothetical protein [Chitinispirillales bacterium]